MHHFIVRWSLGLLCVSWLAGCCCLGDNDGCCGSNGTTIVKARTARKGSRTVVKTSDGDMIIETTPTETLPAPKKAAPTTTPVVPKKMPEAPVQSTPLPVVEPLPIIPLPDMPKENPVSPAPLPIAPEPVREERLEFPPTKVTPKTKPEPGPGLEIAPLPPALMREMSGKEEVTTVKNSHVKYGSVDELQTLTGQVQQWQKSWRLRYAAVDQDDPFGGSVTLDGGAELSKLRDGQHVRVRGIIVPAEDRNGVTRFRLSGLEILD